MVSVIEEGQQQQSHLPLESTPYSLFTIAIRSVETKKKYLQRMGYFLDFLNIDSGRTIEGRCNALGELARTECKWLINSIFNYLQLLKDRVESKEIKASTQE